MGGIQKICKIYGRIKVGNVMWVWDYKNDVAVKESEMTTEMKVASEKAKYELIKKQIESNNIS
jgi:hypothetical protein